jgi:hypothetical protein
MDASAGLGLDDNTFIHNQVPPDKTRSTPRAKAQFNA